MGKATATKTMTPKEYAGVHGVAYTTVMKWLQNNLIPGAYKEQLQSPFTGYIYKIPEGAPRPDIKPGPKPKATKKASKSKR